MDSSLDTVLEQAAELQTRGNILRRVTGASAGLFIALAARGTEVATAGDFACCNLAWTPDSGHWCSGDAYGNFSCPSGYYHRVWYCCTSGHQLFGCGECASGATCNDGPWYCSYGWNTGSTC